jgi:hypothetical protein
MTTYTVLSDNCAVGAKNSTVSDDDLGNCNIHALIEGGHIAVSGGSDGPPTQPVIVVPDPPVDALSHPVIPDPPPHAPDHQVVPEPPVVTEPVSPPSA